MRRFRASSLCCFLLLGIFPIAPACAQSESSSTQPKRLSKAEILAELERMRTRIAELESQLRSDEDTAISSAAEATPAADSTPVESEPAASPQMKAKAEPFAFADWTWLNGNPRTKQSPLDTEAFTGEFRRIDRCGLAAGSAEDGEPDHARAARQTLRPARRGSGRDAALQAVVPAILF